MVKIPPAMSSVLLAGLFSLSMADEVSPLEKVVTMLEDLQTEILVEGKAEAKTYDKFACFCKDMTMEKTEAIQENTDLVTELEAEIAGQFTRREELDNQVAEVVTIIAEKDKALKASDEQRAKDHKEFKIAEDDCFVFKKELDWAVVELMAADEGIDTSGMNLGLASMKTLVEKVTSATDDASAKKALLELKENYKFVKPQVRNLIDNFLQMRGGNAATGHLGSVVKSVKELKPGMEDTLKRLRADEVQSKHQYQMVQQGLTDEKKAQQKIMDHAKKEQGENSNALGQNQKDLTMTAGTLTDDQNFLKELTANCNAKSKNWDQRSQARAAELTALTNALTIINERVATKVSDKTIRFIETKSGDDGKRGGTAALQVEEASDAGAYEDVLDAADHEADSSTMKSATSFLQLGSPRKRAIALVGSTPGEFEDIVRKQNSDKILRKAEAENMQADEERPMEKQLEKELALAKLHDEQEKKDEAWSNRLKKEQKDMPEDNVPEVSNPEAQMLMNRQLLARKKVVGFLKTAGATLHSTQLAALAAQVSTTGPFDKITKLIQELIERLLQEAADEANHQGWCNKEMTEAKEQRERKATSVKDRNEALSTSEAIRDGLIEDIEKLTAELAELENVLEKQTKERDAESEENAATVKENTEGQEAIEEALDMLDKFYKTQAKNEVLVQTDLAAPEMPDAGFDSAYKGGQDSAKGILGMMEVIRDDFKRTVKMTQAAEKEAAKEFLAFETETKMSIATKTNTKTAKEAELAEVKDTINADKEAMIDDQKLLDKALQELIELQPACVPKVESYAERVAKREQEIGALKKALCTLDENGPVQTESADCR